MISSWKVKWYSYRDSNPDLTIESRLT
ncbi:hypothetical protein HWC63_gp245 [Erwinia phage pEp_SNUABM_01]|uniref:Uncharacterized protein n=1 Tax=Erwinia phage pEp_SNUABM_01 TaxID=2601643 RepID=A0A5J6DBC3_9CAUD|nr:hypothetical protein HWC63_gp245 [Erwinia phage pEp_SNUABM_01]QEQ94933.1 hypothetical protein pEpSNUABM01_107 [Erwinia phage pEp_SNUABM_01]